MIRTHMDTLDDDGRARVFARVYEDYVIPVHLSAEQLKHHIECNEVLLDESPLWTDGQGGVVALGLLALRGHRAWIGGFGVAPEWRGRGLSHELCGAMLGRARELGVERVQLEVLTNNPIALRTYLRSGFEIRRDLLVLMRAAEPGARRAEGVAFLESVSPEFLKTAHADVTPCWQREVPSLLTMPDLEACAAGEPGTGHVIFQVDQAVRIQALHARDRRTLEALVNTLASRFPDKALMLLNEPEESLLCPRLRALGFIERLRQHEMVVKVG